MCRSGSSNWHPKLDGVALDAESVSNVPNSVDILPYKPLEGVCVCKLLVLCVEFAREFEGFGSLPQGVGRRDGV